MQMLLSAKRVGIFFGNFTTFQGSCRKWPSQVISSETLVCFRRVKTISCLLSQMRYYPFLSPQKSYFYLLNIIYFFILQVFMIVSVSWVKRCTQMHQFIHSCIARRMFVVMKHFLLLVKSAVYGNVSINYKLMTKI